MKEKINKYLAQLEKEKDIKILFAVETGSRAWGFASTDSDYDVRFVYVHKLNWYLQLHEQKDAITVMYEDNEIDISGWELRKTFRLLQKSNASLLERFQSPIIYQNDTEFTNEVQQLAPHFYSRIACMYHYLGMAKNTYSDIKAEDSFKLKKLFYALRTACCCLWIAKHDTKPPIVFAEVLQGITIDDKLKSRIEELVQLKAEVDESYLHSGDKELVDFIRESIEKSELVAKQLPSGNGKVNDLDALFQKTVKQFD